jgi:2-haloacid dehalogenase
MPKVVPEPKFVTFDCYGTLVQWHRALQTAIRAILAQHLGPVGVVDGQVTDTVEALRTTSTEHQQLAPFREYKTILRSSLAEVMARKGLSPKSDDGEALLSHLCAIPPHPEVPDVLERLRSRFRLAIISNTDDDLIAGTVAAIGVPIDDVITAQQARAYKPNHQLFLHAHAVIGATPDETVHIGMGQVTDLQVCHELGVRAVWINRLGEALNPNWTPHAVLSDLTNLPELLA